ncbi:hypothetical protein GUITHDRAFT_139244 [Guillardia theta CCMP2712]|uniref:non-specific serine/threonine protein kinase n=1 Tax=Guillardia theta (strain CCMP2712) TaxID=905079 RepID=L1J9G0_GUITC|nr:hypothetical protein GUITHDRAFT_139244 [Guillardia theta CCMP2712]EKX44952.1 hypothetical protein GUITHDRAFT_139244 [Guillardia theta CCMP2712]|eukprot:XP_005831932.1 hypothetical protein GUITHDRAFT_139244 [Guillardia theta CCMP2712]
MEPESHREFMSRIVRVIQENGDALDMINENVEEETKMLDMFITHYNSVYDFSSLLGVRSSNPDMAGVLRRPCTQDSVFLQLLQHLLEMRFLEGRWQQLPSGNHRLVVMQSIRILTRDKALQRRFLMRGGGEELVAIFEEEGNKHYSELLDQASVAQSLPPLTHIASMLSKLEADWIIQCRKTMCYLLSTAERFLLQSVLMALQKLSRSTAILSQDIQGILLLPTGDGLTAGQKLLELLDSDKMKMEYRELVADILYNLCQIEENKITLVNLESIRIFLSMVQSSEDSILLYGLRLLERTVTQDSVRQIRLLGGINIVLNILGRVGDFQSKMVGRDDILIAGCSLLSELAFDDENSCHIRQSNGIFILTKVLLMECENAKKVPAGEDGTRASDPMHETQVLAVAAHAVKSIFERFIEIGQYQRDLEKCRSPPALQAIGEMRSDMESDKRIRDYLLVGDSIGKGAFGTIWRARLAGGGGADGPVYYALKEIPIDADVQLEKDTHREVSLLQQMSHPNIVKYVDSFTDRSISGSDRGLYIVMELVEGSSLMELINSHSGKNQRIPERNIRDLLIQICHGLYYIHKKKNITHSQKHTEISVMSSVVGTLTYSCPEIIERRPYTEKADIWSLGVILYQMICLKAPFSENNPLQTAANIVEGRFEPINDPTKEYSDELKELVKTMMNPDTAARPDIIEIMMQINCWDRNDLMKYDLQIDKERYEALLKSQVQTRDTYRRRQRSLLESQDKVDCDCQQRPLDWKNLPAWRVLKLARDAVPAANVKEIDPASQMLNQLHKIVFVTQLPPDMSEGQAGLPYAKLLYMRSCIEKYKRALFNRAGQGLNLKEELKKFLNNREEYIPVDFSGAEISRPSATDPTLSPDGKQFRWGGKLTYHEMCNMLETLLQANNYYESEDWTLN